MSRKIISIICLGLAVYWQGLAQSTDSVAVTKKTLSLVFAGDIMGHDAQIASAYDGETNSYNYEPTFRYIKDYIQHADIAIGNLEVTHAGPPYKGYPQFSSPDELSFAAKEAGFDIMVQANNHALDRGKKGFERTLMILDSAGLAHTGTFIDSASRAENYPVIVEKNDIRIALLNYTYGTNGLKIEKPYSINRIDTAVMRADIEKAKTAEPDYIICAIHWGTEYKRIENSKQRALATFMMDAGVDAIIGSHPHVVQPIRFYYNEDSSTCKPVVYSMGNFVSNQRSQYKDGGIIAELHLSKTQEKTQMDSLLYLPYWVWRNDDQKRSTFYVLPVAYYENKETLLNLSDNDLFRFKRFASDTRTHLIDVKESSFYDK